MNMFKKIKATSVASYLAAVPLERRDIIRFLHGFIRKSAPKLKPHFAYNMLGYGSFPYKNHRNVTLMWPTVALANQKQYVSIYVCSIIDGKYLAESRKKELGKVSVGKSCIRFRRLEDVNLPALKKVIQIAARRPGLVGVGKKR
jgi:hypothetical protein